MAKKLITQATLKAAIRDQRQRKSYDVTDSQAPGLQLRVKPTSVRWSARVRLNGRQRRYDLGRAVEGDRSSDGRVTLGSARALAIRVHEMARRSQDPAALFQALAAGLSLESQARRDAAKPKPSWTWQEAKENFLEDVRRSRREDTYRDYRGKLLTAELQRFDHRMVNTLSRNEMAAAIGDVHARGAEAMAEGIVRVVRRLWSWLAEAVRQDSTNVLDGVMVKLSAPDRTRAEIGEDWFDPGAEQGDAPPEIEIGRALTMARQRYFAERICLGIELLIGTCQRRRTITGANEMRFRSYEEIGFDEYAWYVPPYFRKSGTKRGRRSHLVPCIGFACRALRQLCRLSDLDGNPGWLFPAGPRTRTGRAHAESGLFNDYFSAMPDVNFSPHGVRYAFATYGERDLGFRRGERNWDPTFSAQSRRRSLKSGTLEVGGTCRTAMAR